MKQDPVSRHSDGDLYFVRSKLGAVNVARYIAKYDLFFAVGDSIGFLPDDLVVGNRVDLDGAFDEVAEPLGVRS